MGGTVLEKEDFYKYLESQISRIIRYKADEEFTLVFIQAENELLETIKPILEVNLRKSDIIFEDSDHIFLALANTDKVGALHIDEMLKDFINQDLIYAFSTFPEDGNSQEELFVSIAKICEDEYEIDFYKYLR